MVNLHTASKLKFELAGIANRKELEISFRAGRRSNLVDSYACCFFLRNECFNYDCDSRLQLHTNDSDVNMKYMYPCTNKGSRTMLGIDFSIVTNSRDKSFSRKILRASRNSKLDTRNSKLETRASKLDSRFSKASSIKDRVSSRDCQLTFERYCSTIHYSKGRMG